MSLVIYFKSGETAMFKNVSNVNDNGKELRFNYFGESTQVNREANFNRSCIAGFAKEV